MTHDLPPEALLRELLQIRERLVAAEQRHGGAIAAASPAWHASARNLVHYLALRQIDIREAQRALAALGLSSLGRSESHVLASIDAVLGLLHRLGNRPFTAAGASPGFDDGPRLLEEHTSALLGPAPEGRSVRIMVTLPSQAAHDLDLVRGLVASGMDIARINAAHDEPAAWRRMAENARRAADERGRSCRVELDLPGPKLRTGALAPGPRVLRWRPVRDERGHVTGPARIWLTPEAAPEAPALPGAAVLPVPGAWLAALDEGARVRLIDLRGKKRELRVGAAAGASRWAECDETAYVGPETVLIAPPQSGPFGASARPGELPCAQPSLLLLVGDPLELTRAPLPGRPVLRDARGAPTAPGAIACTLPEVLVDVAPGHRIDFDDGAIGGVVEEATPERLLVRITRAKPGGSRLRADRGINLPDSPLRISALGERDDVALSAAAELADAVALSFARTVDDVEALMERLSRAPGRRLGIVLKIETRRGFEQLPRMLLSAMRSPPLGVMIARGDLAVECGYERLAELQEELLWICEAAHVPVIWATQVLETLARKGVPSRAEITDAAMGERAECVMLNKGPYVAEAARALDDILRRMQAHQSKKTPMLRPLRSLALD